MNDYEQTIKLIIKYCLSIILGYIIGSYLSEQCLTNHNIVVVN